MTAASQLRSELEENTLRCPMPGCNGVLGAFYQKRQGLWCVLHERPAGCRLSFLEFSRSDKKEDGGSPEQAEERCRERIAAYLNRISNNINAIEP